ncbi:MAG: RluA family pseudouridine synthase [Candidatus Enteromonas sp.]
MKARIDASLEGKRIDEALFALGAAPSRSKTKEFFAQGLVFLNGKPSSGHEKLKVGDEIDYELPKARPTSLQSEDIPLDIVYEDEDILIINKPAGLVVHPGNGHQEGTLANALLHHLEGKKLAGDPSRPGIVHRIDKDTSGLLAIAKSEQAFLGLSKQLATHSMGREYLALVKGLIKEEEGKIIAPIARSKKDPLKNAVDVKKGKEATTFFHVEKRYPQSQTTLITCRLLTGRTHQIRVHMEYIGHPVIGDPLYGEGNSKIYDKGQLLHAYRLHLTHPVTGKELSFEAPLPDYFKEVLKNLD